MLQDELAVASVVAVVLKAWLVCDQGLKQRLALDEREVRDVPAGNMQDIESVINEVHAPLAVRRQWGAR